MELEQRRQTAQIFLGVLLIISLLIFGRSGTIIIVGGILVWGILMQQYIIRYSAPPFIEKLLKQFERDKYKKNLPGKGAMTYAIGVFATLILFSEMIILQAVLILSVSDSLSTLFGKKYGRVRLYNGKSVLGSLIFFSSAFLVEFLFQNFLTSVVVAFVTTIIEVLPADDNLTIPLTVGFVLRFIPSLPY